MAAPDECIANPLTGERIVFRRTAEETGGELLEFDLALRPAGVVAGAPHRHRHTEHFQVSAGRLAGWIAGQGRISAGPGDEVTVPSWRDHFLGNGALATTRARVTVRPAGQFERIFELFFALASGRRPPGHTRLSGARELLRLMAEEGIVVAFVPAGWQRAILGALTGAGPPAEAVESPGPGGRRRQARTASRGTGSPSSARPG
jgi:hypothetical protein